MKVDEGEAYWLKDSEEVFLLVFRRDKATIQSARYRDNSLTMGDIHINYEGPFIYNFLNTDGGKKIKITIEVEESDGRKVQGRMVQAS